MNRVLDKVLQKKFWLLLLKKYSKWMDTVTATAFIAIYLEDNSQVVIYLFITAVFFFVVSAVFEAIVYVFGDENA